MSASRADPSSPAQPHLAALVGAARAVARQLGHIGDPRRVDAGLARRDRQRARQRMRRAFGQRSCDRRGLARQGLEGVGARRAGGQRAGLVEDNRVDLREPFECCLVLDQHAPAEEPPRGRRGHRRHGEAQRAGAGDDEHGRRDVERGAQVPGREIPAGKGERRQDMHPRRVELRRAVRQRGVARAPRFRDRHEIGHAVQRGLLAHGGGADGERAGEVDLAGADGLPLAGEDGPRLAGQKRAVDLGGALRDLAIDGHPPARADADQIAQGQLGDADRLLDPVAQPRGARHL